MTFRPGSAAPWLPAPLQVSPPEEPSAGAGEDPVHEPLITIVGNVAWAPRLRTLVGGTVVADFRVASTPRRQDKASGNWSDLKTMWFGVTCWRGLAENAAASLQKGDRVVVTGRLRATSYQTEQGEERSGLEIDVSAVGFDLSRGPVTQVRPERKADRVGEAAIESGEPDPWATPVDADPLTGEIGAGAAEPTAA
jgi:single-strand DNA-binding protein